MDVSILIVCWNSAPCIRQCLTSLNAATNRSTFEIILVDNGSMDATTSIARNSCSRVNVIEAGANLGFARATNVASRVATGRFLFLLNPDAEVSPGALDQLVDFMDSHPEAGAVSPKIMDEDGAPAMFSIREFPSLTSMIIRQFGLRKLFPGHRYFGKETLTNCDRNSVSSVPCVTGAALMVRHSLFSGLGGLDEELPMYFEDLDLCARIGQQQLIYHVPTAQVVHIGGKSSERAPSRSLLLAMEDGEAPWMYLRRYRGRWYAHAFKAITFVSSALRLAVLGAFLPLAAIFGGHRASWTRVRIRHSHALLTWCLSSRKKFYSQVAGFFDLTKPGRLETTT